jgi:hypothetical protein
MVLQPLTLPVGLDRFGRWSVVGGDEVEHFQDGLSPSWSVAMRTGTPATSLRTTGHAPSLVLPSRSTGEKLAGTPYARYFAPTQS